MAEHLFNTCPELSFIIAGEGEMSFLKLVQAMEQQVSVPDNPDRGAPDFNDPALEAIGGLIYKKNTLTQNPPAPLIDKLDDLPHPGRYFVYQHLAMSRGCPGACTFCGSPRFWGTRQVRFHSAQWFADELHYLYRSGVRHFYISDDTLTMDRERVMALCSLILKKRLKITWNAISRVDYVDHDLLSAMRQAGCIQISFGVESGSAKIRGTLGKPVKQAQIIEAFAMSRAAGILPRAYFIYGSPGETRETIQESIDLMQRIKPLSAVFYMLTTFPGTRLFDRAIKTGKVPAGIWQEKIEDLPWFQVDDALDFETVKAFGDQLRNAFHSNIQKFALDLTQGSAQNTEHAAPPDLTPLHADFLSRLAMTFSHGEYANDPRIQDASGTAKELYEKALSYAPDARAFLGLAMMDQQQKQFDSAMEIIEKGLTHFPQASELSVCKGVCLMNLGRFNDALAVFTSIENRPDLQYYIDICRRQQAG